MSQKKVDQYKKEKANRKKIMAREKRTRTIGIVCAWVVVLAVIGWAAYSGVKAYQANQPIETIYANLDAINNFSTTVDEE